MTLYVRAQRGGEAPTFIKTQHICPWPGVWREEKGAEHVVRPVLSCQKHSKLDKQYKIYQKCGGGEEGGEGGDINICASCHVRTSISLPPSLLI